MNVFLDANILITALNKEYPLFSSVARLISLADKRSFHLYTSPICLAIAFYFAEKKSGTALAKKKLALLGEQLYIAACDKKEVQQAANDPRVLDYEDGLEYFSAFNARCTCIVTENEADFYFSEIEILNTEDFLRKYALKQG